MKIILLYLFVSINIVHAQSFNWSDVTSNYTLPEGIKVYEEGSINAYYIDVDLNVPTIAIRPYITSSAATVPTLTSRFGAYAAVNGGYFGGTVSYSAVVYPYEVKAQNVPAVTRNSLSYPVARSFFGMMFDRSLSVDWIYHHAGGVEDIYTYPGPVPYVNNDPTPLPAPIEGDGTPYENLLVGIGGGPTLVKDAIEHITYDEEIFWGSGVNLGDNRARTAVGYTSDGHVIFLSINSYKLEDLPDILIDLGCVEAMNLDGGGSTQMCVGTESLISSTRPVPSILAVVHADSLGLPKLPVYEKIIDTGDEGVFIEGDWNESSNAGYYGQTPAIWHPIGTGDNYVEFKTDLPGYATYEVYGWWVAASNRAEDTPFIIKHADGTDTVRVNETTSGSSWQLIGEYNFSGTSYESIIVSDAAATNTLVVADAVKIIAYDTTGFTSVKEIKDNKIPDSFELYQNYPNPFNPSTKIKYQIPIGIGAINTTIPKVELNVYNILGQKVATLVNEIQPPGYYEVEFNTTAYKLAGSVYIYRLTVGDFSDSNKLVLLK